MCLINSLVAELQKNPKLSDYDFSIEDNRPFKEASNQDYGG